MCIYIYIYILYKPYGFVPPTRWASQRLFEKSSLEISWPKARAFSSVAQGVLKRGCPWTRMSIDTLVRTLTPLLSQLLLPQLTQLRVYH